MADKYPNPPYGHFGNPSAPPQFQNNGNGMQYPQYYPPPSYDAAMRGGGPQMPQVQPQMYPQPMNPGYGQPGPVGFQPMPQPQYYPPMPPGGGMAPGMPPYPQHQGQMAPQQPSLPYPQGGVSGIAPVTAVFDAGARFHNGTVTVPPPPPGYMPTPAQAAAMNGQSVHVQKDKNSFFTGGKGAGFTFW